jgi:hypothetical protein
MKMTTAIPEETDKVLVWHPDDMDRKTFCLHMTHRHADSLAGMSELNPAAQSDYTEQLWRLFHERLHGKGMAPIREKLDHVHEQ